MSATTLDLYSVFGVDSHADVAEIRSAYRRLARHNHPDAGGDERVMIVLNKAWAILRDPERRIAYDAERNLPAAVTTSTTPSPPPNGQGTVMDFGRYHGWSIGQLASHDPDYLLWLRRTPIGRPMGAEIDETLARLRPEPATPPTPPRRGLFASVLG
jgi:curved DNA-binding protein CbpA